MLPAFSFLFIIDKNNKAQKRATIIAALKCFM